MCMYLQLQLQATVQNAIPVISPIITLLTQLDRNTPSRILAVSDPSLDDEDSLGGGDIVIRPDKSNEMNKNMVNFPPTFLSVLPVTNHHTLGNIPPAK